MPCLLLVLAGTGAGCTLARDLDHLGPEREFLIDAGAADSAGCAGAAAPVGADAAWPGPGAQPPADAADESPSPSADGGGSALDGAAPGEAGSAPPADAGGGRSPTAMFWVDSGSRTVHRSGPNGEAPRVILSRPVGSFLRSIAVDDVGRKIYFSDSGAGTIHRANFDGSGLESVIEGLDQPRGLDVDDLRSKIYYVDQGPMPTVFRADLDGTSAETIIRPTIRHPHGLVVDSDGAKVYFLDDELRAVFRANLDGNRVQRLSIGGILVPVEIAFDLIARKIYWSDTEAGPAIRRANLDGSGVEEVINSSRVPGLAEPLGLALDPLGGRLTFVDAGKTGPARIGRTTLDGSNFELLVTEDLVAPRGLALAF